VGDQLFDPVRTAHFGLKSFLWDVQKTVYIPFHFLPPEAPVGTGNSFITKADSVFAHSVYERACKEPDERTRLIAMGIALHTLADTFSHEGFSGRYHLENDVDDISHKDNGSWSHLLIDAFCQDFLPCIGHAQAGHDPDFPYLKWKCKRPADDNPTKPVNPDPSKKPVKRVTRDNPAAFMKACRTIYGLLEQAAGSPSANGALGWAKIEKGVAACLAVTKGVETRCRTWQKRFGHLFQTEPFAYSKLTWRQEALCPAEPSSVDWDPSSRSQFARMHFPMTPGFWDSRWVTFHRAALKHRCFVLQRLL
jgi:hypothetical protein